MIEFCERCKRKEIFEVVQNKRKQVRVYCTGCGSFIRQATKEDKRYLKVMSKGEYYGR